MHSPNASRSNLVIDNTPDPGPHARRSAGQAWQRETPSRSRLEFSKAFVPRPSDLIRSTSTSPLGCLFPNGLREARGDWTSYRESPSHEGTFRNQPSSARRLHRAANCNHCLHCGLRLCVHRTNGWYSALAQNGHRDENGVGSAHQVFAMNSRRQTDEFPRDQASLPPRARESWGTRRISADASLDPKLRLGL